MRARGFLLVVCGALIGAFGTWLLYLTMGWPWPAFLPPELASAAQGPQGTPEERLLSAPGLASLFLLAFGGIAGMLGLGMLVTGRRSAGLMTLLLVLFGVFMATGIAVALSLRG